MEIERSPEFTEDLITEIISRLPHKDLMRFTCVSESWCSLIRTDRHFSNLQLQRTASLHRPFILLIEEQEGYGGATYYFNFLIDLDSIEDLNSPKRKLQDPFKSTNCGCPGTRVMGSCHGLFVLQQFSTRKMVVTNPTTRQSHYVPRNPAGDVDVVFCGFGYDRVHYCYKMVTEVKYESTDDPLDLMVYEVNARMWRKLRFDSSWRSQIDDLDDEYSYSYNFGVECVDGALYWPPQVRLRTWVSKRLICFVLAEEQFHLVETPDFGEVTYNAKITDFEGRLCLVCEGSNTEIAEFWMIDMEYKGSTYSWRWTKLFKILNPYALLPPHVSDGYLIPVCFSGCKNKILFYVRSELFMYDLTNKEFHHRYTGANRYDKASYCVRSLEVF